MVSEKPIRAVIFDFDDTLVNTIAAIERARKVVFSRMSKLHKIDERAYEEAVKITSMEYDKLVKKQHNYENKYFFYETLSKKTGLNFSRGEIEEYFDLFENSLINDTELSIHLEEVIKRLSDAGIKLGILTGPALYPGIKKKRLERLPVMHLFDVIVIARETIPEDKTKVSAFTKTAEMLGVPPNETLFVGDRPDIDIFNSKTAGMKAVLFTAYRKYPDWVGDLAPDYTIADLKELIAIIGLKE